MRTRKRLLLILGAGSSLDCGMPSVGAIDDLMRWWAQSYAARVGSADYFALAWEALERRSAQGFRSGRSPVNFERALSDLVALMHWLRPSPEGSALRHLVGAPAVPPLSFPHPNGYGPYLDIKAMVAHLLAQLAAEMRARCRRLVADSPGMVAWRAVLDALRARFDVVIYNLNYDTVALSCWPDAFTGFDVDGRFDPGAVYRRDWEGVFHLHGSVHLSLAEPVGERMV